MSNTKIRKITCRTLIFLIIILITILTLNLFFPVQYSQIIHNWNPHFAYRIGDMIRSSYYRNKIDGKKYHLSKWPDSIVSKYLNETNNVNDFNLLRKIIDEPCYNNFDKPGNNVIVIHLRTGDILHNQNVDKILKGKYKHSDHIYIVKNYEYYDNIIEQIKKENEDIKNFVIITGNHRKLGYKESNEYVEKIIKRFEDNGFVNVGKKINGSPDEDFIYMSNSNYFINSGGGFSKLIKEMVKIKGGKVFEYE